jgi:uncharacterized membrane protein
VSLGPTPPPLPRRAPSPPAPRPPRAAGSVEQRIGTRWLLIAGIVVILLGGAFFFKYAYDMGWVRPAHRCVMGAIFGLLMLGAGEWSLRRKMRMYASGLIGAGIVWLYYTVFAAGPNGPFEGLRVFQTAPPAFALMCVVTLIGIAMSLRADMPLAAVVSLAGALATPVLLSTGRNEEVLLLCYLLAVDAGFLAVALAKRWQPLAPISIIGTAVIFALWFSRHYSGDAFAVTVAFAWALLAVHAAYAVTGAAWKRASRELGAVVLAAGVAGVVVLLAGACDSADYRHAMSLHFIALTAVLAAYLLWQDLRWCFSLATVTIGATLASWFGEYFAAEAAPSQCAYLWAMVALPLAATALKREDSWQPSHVTSIAGFGALLVASWLRMGTDLPAHGLLLQLLALDLVVLALCMRGGWNWLRAGVLFWTFVAIADQYGFWSGQAEMRWFTSAWAWVFFGLLTGDILVRAWSPGGRRNEPLDAVLSVLALAAMFGGTYSLLRDVAHDWMGGYTAAIAASAIVTAWLLRRSAGREILGRVYLIAGLVLVTLAMPIQFDRSDLTIAWAALGVATMIFARGLRSRPLLVQSPVVLLLALVNFILNLESGDAWLTATWMEPSAVPLRHALLLGTAVAAAFLAAAAIFRLGKPFFGKESDEFLTQPFVLAGTAVFLILAATELPAVTATWAWTALLAGLAAVGLWRRTYWLCLGTLTLFFVAAAKWVLYDTLGLRLQNAAEPLWVVANWQFAIGAVLTAVLVCLPRAMKGRGFALSEAMGTLIVLTAAWLLLWGGSFEVDRYFTGSDRSGWQNPGQAMHMAYSLWWGLYAAVLLVIGFAAEKPPLRYLAMAVVAVTLGKVFLVDMRHIEAVYRILSFMGLGILLLAGSWLYHRHWRVKTPPPANAAEAVKAD